MDYLPYARQDKVITNSTTFALTAFSHVLNSLNLDKVTALDSHSDAPLFLINNFVNIFPYQQIYTAINETNSQILCFPDKGALKRYGKELAPTGKIYVFGEKTRDQQTGHITKYELIGDVFDKNVLIVDDLCDGGMTFILLTKQILTNGAKSVNLYTTHGIYSKGLKPLKESGINRIFNKNGEINEISSF
jgi:ribose-phosphate pyrophosphokinase